MPHLTKIVAITAITVLSGVASAQQVGVVGLYQGGKGLNVEGLKSLGCSPQRRGEIVAMQGELASPLPQPDQFVVLSCDQPMIANSEARAALSALSKESETVVFFEGISTHLEDDVSPPNVTSRQYILKLGFYNNMNIEAREADLKALGKKASQREGVWTTESILHVHTASGIETPDEVVVLHYDNAEIAQKFRDENQDVLEDVGAFNGNHLSGFTYLIGSVTE